MANTIVIGKRISQDVAAILGGISGTLSNQTDLVAALGAKTSSVNGVNIIYVGKHGNDSNSGLFWESAKLTFSGALAAISGQSSTNRFVIVCLDGGNYTLTSTEISNPFTNSGSWTANVLELPSYVNIFAPFASIQGSLVLSDNSNVELHNLISQATSSSPSSYDYKLGCSLIKSKGNQTTGGIGSSYAKIKYITNYGGSAISNWAELGTLQVDIGTIFVYNQNDSGSTKYGNGIGDNNQLNGFGIITGHINQIVLNSNYQKAVELNQTGLIAVLINTIKYTNASLVGAYTIYCTAGKIRTGNISYINCIPTIINIGSVISANVYTKNWGKAAYGLYFDGVDDYISFGDILSSIADYDFTIETIIDVTNVTGTYDVLSKKVSAGEGYRLEIYTSSGITRALLQVFGTTTSAYVECIIPATGVYHIAAVKLTNTAANWKIYINGMSANLSISGTTATGTITNTQSLTIGKNSAANNNYAKGIISVLTLYNYALSPEEINLRFNNGLAEAGINFMDKDGSYTELTSGTLTAGYKYYIKTFNAGDDFANVGAASNSSGVTFTATGTTPTTWTNSSVLFRVGRVLDLNFAEASNITLPDKTAARLHGAISGALPISRALISPANKTGITGNSTITEGNRQGYSVDFITVKNNNGTNTVSANIGSTANGTEYGQVTDLAAGATTVIAANKYLAHSANQNIYIYPTGTNVNIDVLTSQTRRS